MCLPGTIIAFTALLQSYNPHCQGLWSLQIQFASTIYIYIYQYSICAIAAHRSRQVVGRYLDGVMEGVQQQTKAMMQAFSGGEASLGTR